MATLADILCDRRTGTTTKVEHRPTRRDERAKTIQPPAFVKAAFSQPRVDPSVSMPLIDVDNALRVGAYKKMLRLAKRCCNGRLWPACCRASPLRPRSRTHDAYERVTLHSVALGCVALRRPPFGSVGRAPAPCVSGLSRNLRDYESASAWITLSFMDQNLCRRLVPRPKFGRSHPTTAAAAPATSRSVHLQVVGREQMAVAADIGDGHALEDTFQGKAHEISFGCSKARPRYQLRRFATLYAGTGMRQLRSPSAASCLALSGAAIWHARV